MAINKVVYGSETLVDLTEDTATADDVASGQTFHLASGNTATGTALYASAPVAHGNADKTNAILYGTVDSTSTNTKFTATVDGLESLEDGTCVMLKNGVVTSASGFTLNVNSLGAKPVYSNLAAASRDTTIFNVAYTMMFVYDSTRVSGGAWICFRGYDGNTNYFDRYVLGNIQPTTGAASGRYSIGFMGKDGKFYGVAQTSSTGTSKTLNTGIEFDGTSLYYQLTATYAASKAIGKNALYSRYPSVDIRYSSNQGSWMTAEKPVFMILHRETDGYFTLGSTIFTHTLPTSADGLYYVYVGFSYSTSAFNFDPRGTIYYHNGTQLCILGDSAGGGATAMTDTEVIAAVDGAFGSGGSN